MEGQYFNIWLQCNWIYIWQFIIYFYMFVFKQIYIYIIITKHAKVKSKQHELWLAIRKINKLKGQSRKDNPEKLETLGTQDTRRRHKQTQHRKLKRWATQTPTPKINNTSICSSFVGIQDDKFKIKIQPSQIYKYPLLPWMSLVM
jgi:hypothetical protein